MAMIAHHKPDFIHSVVTIATPFQPGSNMMERFVLGYDLGMTRRTFNAEVVSSFPSFYSFFPTDPAESDMFDVETGEEIALDYFDPVTWKERKLGIFAHPKCNQQTLDEYFRFLEQMLPEARAFQNLAYKLQPGVVYPPLACVVSNAHRTGVNIGADTNGKMTFYLHYEPGDGTVGMRHSVPHDRQFKLYVSRQRHSKMPNDTETVSLALKRLFLVEHPQTSAV